MNEEAPDNVAAQTDGNIGPAHPGVFGAIQFVVLPPVYIFKVIDLIYTDTDSQIWLFEF